MQKPKLIKKDSPLQEQIKQSRRSRRTRGKKTAVTKTAIELTTEWLKQKKDETPGPREAFAALFNESDPILNR